MLERVVYFSGPSGNGKTSLIRELLNRNPEFIPGNPEKLDREKHVRDKKQKFGSYYDYAVAKIDERLEHARHHADLELQNPNLVVLGDRCVHDTTAYIMAGVGYGWLTEEQVQQLLGYQRQVHQEEFMPKSIVFLDFPVNELMNYLKRRWERERIGDRESEHYLTIDIKCFKSHFRTLDNLLRITERKEANISIIESWIKERVRPYLGHGE